MKQKVLVSIDPGHDDAYLLLLAMFHQKCDLIGVTTVAGNQSLDKVTINALNILNIVGKENIPVVKGSERPLLAGEHAFCQEIHGDSGLDTIDKTFVWPPLKNHALPGRKAVEFLAEKLLASNDEKIHVVATGCLTDIALLLTLYPECIPHIAQISIMGGSFRAGGNTGRCAEFNIQIDPESAQIVFNHGATPDDLLLLQTTQKTPQTTTLRRVPIVLMPLDVTHTCLATPDVFKRIEDVTRQPNNGEVSPFGKLCVDLLSFFKQTYLDVFEMQYPPLHDVCALFYALTVQHNISNEQTMPISTTMINDNDGTNKPDAIIQPIFKTRHCNIEVECGTSMLTRGTTCVDFYGLQKKPANVILTLEMNVDIFWEHFIDAIKRANDVSILNQ